MTLSVIYCLPLTAASTADAMPQAANDLIQLRDKPRAGGSGLAGVCWRMATALRFNKQAPVGTQENMRLVFVQFGDYAEPYERFESGGEETYYAQKHSVKTLGQLVARPDVDSLMVIACDVDSPTRELPNGVRTRGFQLYGSEGTQEQRDQQLLDLLEEAQPTHVIARLSNPAVFKWAMKRGIPILPFLADSYRTPGWKDVVRRIQTAWLLNDPRIPMIANHSLSASLDLVRIGVDPAKIVPWDWPEVMSPKDYPVKAPPLRDDPFRLLYVGKMLESKGVGDLIDAVAQLHRRGYRIDLTLVGNGDVQTFQDRIAQRDTTLVPHITFAGLQPRSSVLSAQIHTHAAVVPSRHKYPEGLPLTLYETMCTRTPLITSDHPMFSLRIHHEKNALVFAEKDSTALAHCIQRLIEEPDLYERLSRAPETAAADYLMPVKSDQVYTAFLDPEQRQQLLDDYALSTGRYSA